MKKQELKKQRPLKATQQMMKMAADDTPRRQKDYYGYTTVYDRSFYMRCRIKKGILTVAFFFTEHLRSDGRSPAYELFIERKNKKFITYDHLHNCWRTATLSRLVWPNCTWYAKHKWMSQREHDLIKSYLNVEKGGYDGLLEYQLQIRAWELEKRHKMQTDPWDADLAQVPKLPKDWTRWVSKVGVTQNYIYYNYSKKGAETGYCTFCEKDVPIKKPRHNKQGRCKKCHREIIFKAIGKAGPVMAGRNIMYLIQRCKDGFVIREFLGYRMHRKGEYKTPEISSMEVRRTICDKSGKPLRSYYWDRYKMRNYRWIQTNLCPASWWGAESGKVYGKTIPSLAKAELRGTGLPEAIRSMNIIDPEKYLVILPVAPYLERLAKANLPRMVEKCIRENSGFKQKMHDAKATSLTKMFGINTQTLKRLRKNNGGLWFLDWVRYEKSTGKHIPDYIIDWFCTEGIKADKLRFIARKMSMVQIYNYIRRQMVAGKASSKDVLTTWADYLSMARRHKMDTNDEIVYRANKLFQRHNELVELCHSKDLTVEAIRVLKCYPHVDDVCMSIKEKYEYANDKYTIIVPSRIEDILQEGRNLHHCLGRSDRYWERIERREAYVLFLRRTSDISKAYYTLEVEPNGTVRQKRTMYDRQEADIEDATKFLVEWQRVLSKRLTPNDFKLAETSRKQRIVDYAQLRENKAVIQTGELAGSLLVDALLADLMENTIINQAA